MRENLVFVYFFTVIFGFLLEILLSKLHFRLTKKHYKIHHFTFSKYFLFILFPLIGIFFVWYIEGLTVIKVFILFGLVGDFLEWFGDWSYNIIVGQRLWIYPRTRYSISGYTSLLSIPLWGFLGVFFWILLRIFQ